MIKRIIIVVIILAVLFGLIFGFHAFRQYMIGKFVHKMLSQAVTISTAKAERQTWVPTLRAVGSLTAVNGVDVNSEVSGQVIKIYFKSGQQIAAKTVLIQLDDALDKENLKMQQAQYNLNKQDYARKLQLGQKKVISQDEQDRSHTQLLQSQSAVATAQLNIEKKQIKAPFAGRLGISQVNLGQYVTPGQPLVSLQQMDPLFVDFSLPEQKLGQLSGGQKLSVDVDAFPNQPFAGEIVAVNSRVDISTHTISVRALLPNPKNQLYPGIFVEVNVALAQQEGVVTIPQTAVAFSLHGDSVFVVENKGKDAQGNPNLIVTQKFVNVGDRKGNVVAVLSGLEPGEEVVTSGQLKLQPGMRVNINNSVKLD